MIDREPDVKRVLEEWGFSVEKIPESMHSGVKTPDYIVRDSGTTYVLEVKTRNDDPSETIERHATLDRGELYAEHIPIVRTNTTSGIIRDASLQLERYSMPGAFKIAWFAAAEYAQEAKFAQLEAALTGTTRMFDLESGDGFHRPCYFFRNSDFYRYRSVLDAAILSDDSSGKMFLNPFSMRAASFKKSLLALRFADAVCDPLSEEQNGEAYVVDSDVNRKNEEAVMAFLREKYKSPKLMNIDMGWHAATIARARDA